MLDNKEFIDKQYSMYFNGTCEGFAFTLMGCKKKPYELKYNEESENALKKVDAFNYDDFAATFKKYDKTFLSKARVTKTPISKELRKDIENRVDSLINNTVDMVEDKAFKAIKEIPESEKENFRKALCFKMICGAAEHAASIEKFDAKLNFDIKREEKCIN